MFSFDHMYTYFRLAHENRKDAETRTHFVLWDSVIVRSESYFLRVAYEHYYTSGISHSNALRLVEFYGLSKIRGPCTPNQ